MDTDQAVQKIVSSDSMFVNTLRQAIEGKDLKRTLELITTKTRESINIFNMEEYEFGALAYHLFLGVFQGITSINPALKQKMTTTIGKKLLENIGPAYHDRLNKRIGLETAGAISETPERRAVEERKLADEVERGRVEKLKKLVKVSEALEIPQMAKILGLSEEDLYARIIDWAAEFGFTIDRRLCQFLI